MKVTETIYKLRIRPWGKTKGSLAAVQLPKGWAAGLARRDSSSRIRHRYLAGSHYLESNAKIAEADWIRCRIRGVRTERWNNSSAA